ILVYPQDEPDESVKTDGSAILDEDMTAVNVALRAAMVPIPELAHAKLGVIYNCSSGLFPGIATFDWIGCDDYNAGCRAAATVGGGSFPLSPGQRIMVVPGGADP